MTTVMTRRLLLACTCALLASCPRNPATGKRQLNFISDKQEVQLGQQGAEEVRTSMGIYDNEGLQRYLGEVGAKLSAVSERPKLPWTFQLVDDTVVNAFALPGGPIFVTRGLLAHLKNEAQLAMVMGHEVGHVTAEHSANQLSKQQIASVGLGLGAVLSQQLAGLASSGMQLLFLKYGRDDERQADDLGLRYSGKAGYDVHAAPEVFEVLKRVSEASPGGGRVPAWLSTHPDPEERVKTMQARLAKMAPADFAGHTLEEDRFMQALDGLVYGDDPREGVIRGSKFCHPGMRFCVDFPDGWQLQNTKAEVQAQPQDGSAGMTLGLGPNVAPEAAIAQFFEKSGAKQAGAPTPMGQALAAPFTADTQQGAVGGWIAFLPHGDATFQFLLLTEPNNVANHQPNFQRLVTSVAPLTDPAILNAKPKRLKVQKLPQGTSLQALQQQHPAATIDELARLNQRENNGGFQAGEWAKWVVDG